MAEGKREVTELTADVSEDAIQAALDSVERGERGDRLAESSSAVPTPGFSKEVERLEGELQEVRAQLDLSVGRARETLDRLKETHERHLRAAADLENFKKRAAREKDEVERFGIQRLLKDLLPVIDNLDRALEHGEAKGPLGEGVAATRRIFEETLARYGVKAFTAVGQPFDPTRHEAMQQLETSAAAPGTVVSEMIRGYLLHDRLVRPALVAVAVAPGRVPAEEIPLPPAEPSGAAELPPVAPPEEPGETS